MNMLDRQALMQGGSVALVFAIPFSIAAQWIQFLVVFAAAGFIVGAGVAAWVQRTGFPLLHGMVCASATYVVAQAVFVAIKLFRDGDVNWFGVFFNFTVALVAGVIGGGLGSSLQKRGLVPSTQRSPREGSS